MRLDAVPMAEMNTLVGVKGRDFVLLGGDSAFFRSVVVMDTVSLEAAADMFSGGLFECCGCIDTAVHSRPLASNERPTLQRPL